MRERGGNDRVGVRYRDRDACNFINLSWNVRVTTSTHWLQNFWHLLQCWYEHGQITYVTLFYFILSIIDSPGKAFWLLFLTWVSTDSWTGDRKARSSVETDTCYPQNPSKIRCQVKVRLLPFFSAVWLSFVDIFL